MSAWHDFNVCALCQHEVFFLCWDTWKCTLDGCSHSFVFVCFHERKLNIVNEEDAAMANPEAQFEGSETKGRKESSMQEDWGILARRLLGSAIDASNQ